MEKFTPIKFDDIFIEYGFKEIGNKSGKWVLKLNSKDSIVCHFLQREWSVKNWLTIELIQNKNRYIKFNGVIYRGLNLIFLLDLVIKQIKNE